MSKHGKPNKKMSQNAAAKVCRLFTFIIQGVIMVNDGSMSLPGARNHSFSNIRMFVGTGLFYSMNVYILVSAASNYSNAQDHSCN